MAIIAFIMIMSGILLILRSSSLSGRVLSPDDIFREGGFVRTVRHIFAVRPFSGYEKDKRILFYGLMGLLTLACGFFLFFYALLLVYATVGNR